MKNYKMNSQELQVTFILCIIFFLRMLGMFMVAPILTHYSTLLSGSNAFLIGLSMGIYGIAQIIFQIPFGILSDKFGRKYIIIFGLVLFFIGNMISAITHSIFGLIIGRFFQGSSAISGVLMALSSDLIRHCNHKKSIAAIGLSFALSFLISIIAGPIVSQYYGFFSIFWISSFFSLFCIYIVCFFIPNQLSHFLISSKNIFNKEIFLYCFNKKLIRYYISIFFLHFFLVINFMVIPHQLELSGLSLNDHWKIYFITVLISLVIVFFIIFFLKRYFFLKNIIEICIFLFLCSDVLLFNSLNNLMCIILALQIFFIAFNVLEVFLPSSLSKQTEIAYKGSVMSFYSTSQFLGLFLGGLLSGTCLFFFDIHQVIFYELILIILWFVINIFLKK